MRVRYVADGDATTAFGRVFRQGEWVEIADLPEPGRGKLAANPAFETESARRPRAAGTPPSGPPASRPAAELAGKSVDELVAWLNRRGRAVERGQMPKTELLRLAQEILTAG